MSIFRSGARVWRYFDWRLFFVGLILSGIGLMSIAATHNPAQLKTQIIALVLGLLFFLVMSSINYLNYKNVTEIVFGLAVFLLIVVWGMGHTAYHAQRWLQVGGFSFQPTELMKIAMIFMLAKYLEKKQGNLDSLLDLLPGFILVGVPFFLIFNQPDLGSAIVLLVIFLAMTYWSGMKLSRLFMLVSPLLSVLALTILSLMVPVFQAWTAWGIYLFILLLVLWLKHFPFLDTLSYLGLNIFSGIFAAFFWNSLHAYQQARLTAFINPAANPSASYHTMQAVTAIGSGGFFGKGWMQGALTNLRYVPQQHTDFIFSVIGEQFGFIGTVVTICLLFYLLYRIYLIALQATSNFGCCLAVGILACLGFQIIISVAMNIGLAPVVGIPLPFISYGGTALTMYWLALGIVQSVSMYRQTIKI